MLHISEKISIQPQPTVADTIQLRSIQLPLPVAPEAWHRLGKSQPCTASVRLTYASSVASAVGDDVAKTIDYGKLFRAIKAEMSGLAAENSSDIARECDIIRRDGEEMHNQLRGEVGQDIRLAAGLIAKCGMKLLGETAVRISSLGTFSNTFALSRLLSKSIIVSLFGRSLSCNQKRLW